MPRTGNDTWDLAAGRRNNATAESSVERRCRPMAWPVGGSAEPTQLNIVRLQRDWSVIFQDGLVMAVAYKTLWSRDVQWAYGFECGDVFNADDTREIMCYGMQSVDDMLTRNPWRALLSRSDP
jgi:hypothetical protein